MANTNRTLAELRAAIIEDMKLNPGLITDTERNRFINRALLDLSDMQLFEKEVTLEYTDGVITLPDDFMSVVYVLGSNGAYLKAMPLNTPPATGGTPVGYIQKPTTIELWPKPKGRTNLLTANQSSVETDLTGFTYDGENVVLTRDTSVKLFGNASLKAVTPANAGYGPRTIRNTVPGLPGRTYTASIYLKGLNGNERLFIELQAYTASGIFLNCATSYAVLSTDWQRFTVTLTTAENTAYLSLKWGNDVALAQTFWTDGLQIEENPYATSWQLGGEGTVKMSYIYRLPQLTSDEERPDLPNGYDDLLVDFAVALCHRKNGNMGIYREYMGTYNLTKESLRMELTRKLNTRIIQMQNSESIPAPYTPFSHLLL